MHRWMLYQLFKMAIQACSTRPHALQYMGDIVTLWGHGGKALEAMVQNLNCRPMLCQHCRYNNHDSI